MARRYNGRGETAMNCPNCRASLSEGSRFCSSCGKPVPAEPANEAPRFVPATDVSPAEGSAAERRPGAPARSEWPVGNSTPSSPDENESRSRTGLFLVALLLGLLVGGGALWLLTHSHGASGSVATVPSSPLPRGPSVLNAPAAPRTPAPPQPQGMPEDIRRYLAFLQGVESQRKQYEGQLTNQMLAVVPNLLAPNFDENSQPPDQQMVRQYDQMAQQYAQATIRFQSAARGVTVPLACRKLHGYYSTALSLNPRLILETSRRLATGDYSGLLAMRSSIGKTIEENYRGADDELARICEQYGVRKSFDIGNGGGGNSVLSP
jgi:hypothetical protein